MATHVLIDKGETTIVGHESGNLLAIFDQLHTHALADSRVRLLGFNTNLLEHNALGVRSGGKWFVVLITQMRLVVSLVCPTLVAAGDLELTSSAQTTRLVRTH